MFYGTNELMYVIIYCALCCIWRY